MSEDEKEKFLKQIRELDISKRIEYALNEGAVFIKGYTRKDGTEVRPHIRTVKRDKQ
jgi:hypothetical protein